MNRILMAALATGMLLVSADSASAQYGRGYGTVHGFSYSTPYYSYRSYGPGTGISRYASPVHSTRHFHTVPRTTHYHLPSAYSRSSFYYSHPHTHYRVPCSPYGYRRSGVSFSIGF